MIKAKLTNSTIIELAQDCDCTHHSGPHWLHLDTLDKERATEALNNGNLQAHISLELARLDIKLYEMERRGIAEIIRDTL